MRWLESRVNIRHGKDEKDNQEEEVEEEGWEQVGMRHR